MHLVDTSWRFLEVRGSHSPIQLRWSYLQISTEEAALILKWYSSCVSFRCHLSLAQVLFRRVISHPYPPLVPVGFGSAWGVLLLMNEIKCGQFLVLQGVAVAVLALNWGFNCSVEWILLQMKVLFLHVLLTVYRLRLRGSFSGPFERSKISVTFYFLWVTKGLFCS